MDEMADVVAKGPHNNGIGRSGSQESISGCQSNDCSRPDCIQFDFSPNFHGDDPDTTTIDTDVDVEPESGLNSLALASYVVEGCVDFDSSPRNGELKCTSFQRL